MKMSEKKLGFGLMRMPKLPEGQGKPKFDHVDLGQVCRMVDLFLERGYTYFDTAWMYHNFRSEQIVKEVLTERVPRDRYTLADKLHIDYLRNKTPDEVLSEQLDRCGVEYFDYYLIHDIGHENYARFGELNCFEWLLEKREEGKIRHIGFSCHDTPELLDQVLTEHPEFEFVQLQINYLDFESPGIRARECYETVTAHGRPVVVMEPVKGGTLGQLPEPVAADLREIHPDWSTSSWAIRFAASLPNVSVVLSGMSSIAQMEENTSAMSGFTPLTETEGEAVLRAAEAINADIAIPCTACEYCVPGCPMNISIPKYFALYNVDQKEAQTGWTPQMEYYERLALRSSKASDCIGCGQCESVCPQHLSIIRHLETVADYFE